MIVIGDSYIPHETITVVDKIEDIKFTNANTTVVFKFCKNMMKYCMVNDVSYGVMITSIKESIYANNLNAKYILPSNRTLEPIQKIAENYMFDSKILATIHSEDEIEKIALKSIDGVILDTILENKI